MQAVLLSPETRYKVVVSRCSTVHAEGSNNMDKQRSSMLCHRGQSVWHAYKGKVAEDGRSVCFPVKTNRENAARSNQGEAARGNCNSPRAEIRIDITGQGVFATRDNRSQEEGQRKSEPLNSTAGRWGSAV